MWIGLIAANSIDVTQDIFINVGMQVKGCRNDPVPCVAPQQFQQIAAGIIVGLGGGGAVKGSQNAVEFPGGFNIILQPLAQHIKYAVRHPSAGGGVHEQGGDQGEACLLGGIEEADELVGKCDKVGFSQAEVLAEGFNYSTLASHLLDNKPASDPYSVCKDYFTQYDIQEGAYRSATISLIDCNKLEPLADLCGTLFSKYSEQIENIRHTDVQRYFRSSKHWFYDLQSIL